MLLTLDIVGCLNVSNKRAKGFTLRWNKWVVWKCRQVACFYFRHTTAIWYLYASRINQLDRMLHTESKVHGADMGPIWGRQDPGGPHVGPMNLAIWASYVITGKSKALIHSKSTRFQIQFVVRWQVGSGCDNVTACYVGNWLSPSEHWMVFNETVVCIEHLFG